MRSLSHLNARHRRSIFTPDARLNAFVAFVVLAFLLGGGSRADVASLIILRPIAFLFTIYAILAMQAGDLARYRGVWIFAGLITMLPLIHIIPLPPTVWHALPGRGLFAQIDRLAGLGDVWRPIALVPDEAWNALFSLVVPLAALTMASVQRTHSFDRILLVIIAIGFLSELLSLLQLLGPSHGPFYFYRITNPESAVGLFANRNHNAAFLAVLLPMLAVWGSAGVAPRRGRRDWRPVRRSAAMVIGWLALFFIVVSGSRAGLFLGILSLLATPFVIGQRLSNLLRPDFSAPRMMSHRLVRHWRAFAALGMIAMLGVVLALGAGANTAARLAEGEEGRPDFWRATWPLIGEYFPVGSGFGSFVEVFKVGEPDKILSDHYVNHAHNDVLEALLTGGLPAALLMLGLLLTLAVASVRLWRCRRERSTSVVQARIGLVTIVLLLLASVVDYPLRTPALAMLFAISATWLSNGLGCVSPGSSAGTRRADWTEYNDT